MVVRDCRSSIKYGCIKLLSILSLCYAEAIFSSHANTHRIQSLRTRRAELTAELKKVEDTLRIYQEHPRNWTLGKAVLLSDDRTIETRAANCDFVDPGLEDKYAAESCRAWAADGECTINSIWMLDNCKRSCAKPHVPADTDEHCAYWAQIGECAKRTFVCENCATSCRTVAGQRCGAPGPMVPVDTDANCAYWAQTGECSKKSYMCENCATSCYKLAGLENNDDKACADTPGWKNPHGYGCNDYINKWCSNGGPIPGQEWTLGPNFGNPESNCVACGKKCGGSGVSTYSPPFWHHMFKEVVVDEGNHLSQMISSRDGQCESACDANPSCHSIAFCSPNQCYLKDKKVTGLEPRKPNPTCQTLFKSSQGYIPSDPALLRPSSSQVYTFHVYWAGSSKDFNPDGSLKFVLGNNDMSSLAASLWYLHNEVIGTCDGSGFLSASGKYPWGSRKFAIDRIKRLKITMKPTQPLSNKGMKYSLFKAFDHGESTGPHRDAPNHAGVGSGYESLPEWNEFGYTIGCRHPADHSKDFASSRKYPGSMWYSMPGPCPTKNRKEASEDCKKEYPGGLCDSPTGQGNCTWFYEDVGMIDIDELVGIKPRWKDRAEFCSQCHFEGNPQKGGGCGLNFWGPNIWDVSANQRRIDKLLTMFKEKYPTINHMEAPACDFNLARYKR